MAITKILHMKESKSSFPGKHLKQAIKYITDKTKTDNGRLVSGINCQPSHAYEQMKKTKELFSKTDKRQGYHMIISFVENEVTTDEAFKIIGEFANEYLGKEYEAVYAVHDNTDHIHGHIIFNSVSFLTGKKYRYEKGDWAKYIQPITNKLCEKYGLSTITIEEDRTEDHESYNKWEERRDGYLIWSDMIKRDIDACIIMSDTFEGFLKSLADKGYEIKQNKYLAVRPPGMKRFRRTKYFGVDYTEERIRERILTENMNLYQRKQRDMRILRVTVPYHLKRAKLSGVQRRYFAKLYRMGLLKSQPYSQAWKYKDDIKRMKKLQAEYLFLADNDIKDFDDLKTVLLNVEDNRKGIERDRKKLYKERSRYRELWDCMDKMNELSPAERAYTDGDTYFKEEHERYISLRKMISDAGFTEEELGRLRSYYDSRLKELKEEYSEVSGTVKLAKTIERELMSELEIEGRLSDIPKQPDKVTDRKQR